MGLMPQQMNVPPQDQAAAPERDPARYTDEADSGVSPEEQEQYSKFEENYMRMIYTEEGQVNPQILESLKNPAPLPREMEGQAPPPPVAALATTAIDIIQTLDDSAREAGKPITNDVLVQGGVAVIEELAEVAEAAGVHDYSEDELSGVVTLAMNMYRDKALADGRTDEEALNQDWSEIKQANEQGRDEELLGAMETENGGR